MINEQFSEVIQEYVVREIKAILNKYKNVNDVEAKNVENLISRINNTDIKEELFKDWNKTVELANEIGEKQINDTIFSIFQWIRSNTNMAVSIDDVIEYCTEIEDRGYVIIDECHIVYKRNINLRDVARELLDNMLEYGVHVDRLLDKDSLIEYWMEGTSKEEVIDDLISGVDVEELLDMNPITIYQDRFDTYIYSEIYC